MKKSARNKPVLFWFPELFESIGGIQTYSRFFLKSYFENCPGRSVIIQVKNDRETIAHSNFISHAKWKCYGAVPAYLRTLVWGVAIFTQALIHRPALIVCGHAHFSGVAWILKCILGTDYAVIVHGTDVWNIRSQWIKRGLQNARSVISVSRYTEQKIKEQRGLNACRFDFLPNTYREDLFFIREKPAHLPERLHLKPESKVILSVGRLASVEQYKGHDLLIQSMPVVLEKFPTACYVIVGEGSDRQRLEEFVREKKVSTQVIFAGRVTDEELVDYYHLCSLFAMPSSGEGFGIVYLEALACGKPVIAGKDGAQDALMGGALGILTDVKNQKGFEQVLLQVLGGSYPHAILYRPEELARRVKLEFGWDSFKLKMRNLWICSPEFATKENQ